jgi:hypothetical protein
MNKYKENKYTIEELENEILIDILSDKAMYDTWFYICKYQKLTCEFMEKYYNHLNWGCICYYQKLSEEFIEKHTDKIDWGYISVHQKLSYEFINKHIDKLDWNIMFKYQTSIQ